MKGFTLIELMIVVAVGGILTAIVTNSFGNAKIRKEQDGVVQTLISHIEKQKADTQAGKDGSAYGVRFASSSYTLYKGTAYSPTSPSNVEVKIPTSFQIGDSVSNTNNVLYFSKLTGGSNETATITVSEITNKITPKQILIESSGNISVIK